MPQFAISAAEHKQNQRVEMLWREGKISWKTFDHWLRWISGV